MESNKLEYKLYNKSVVVLHEWMEATKMSLWYVASFPLDQYQAWLNAAHFGQDMARVDTSFAHLSRAFREPFARNLKKKWVDTISYLVFRGSSANLSPTCTFLERYLSRRHLKSMPVDLDYIKPFMGFCTTLIYVYVYWSPYGVFYSIRVAVLGGWTCSWNQENPGWYNWDSYGLYDSLLKNRQTLFVYSLKKNPKEARHNF